MSYGSWGVGVDGVALADMSSLRTVEYRFVTKENLAIEGAISPTMRVVVQASVRLSTQGTDALTFHKPLTKMSFEARLPLGPKGHSVKLQVSRAGKWVTVTTATLNAQGVGRFAIKAPKKGDYKYRVLSPASLANGVGTSNVLKVKIR